MFVLNKINGVTNKVSKLSEEANNALSYNTTLNSSRSRGTEPFNTDFLYFLLSE